MSFEIVFCLITIVCFSTTYASSWAELKVPVPPPSSQLIDEKALLVVNSLISATVDNENSPFTFPYRFPFSVEQDVTFELYTPKNPKVVQALKLDDVIMAKNSNFDSKIPTRMLINGWLSDGKIFQKFTDSYLVDGQYKVNLIVVKWQKESYDINYFCARRRVNGVGEYVARFIDFMSKQLAMDVSTLTIIGQSLGAHVAGIAGKKVTGNKVGKIVALDPALPSFKFRDVENRLAKTDASYVEVIYTCSGKLGHTEPLGHANFYPNGGRFQPGCGWDMLGTCAHSRSWHFFFESVVSPQFFAFECDSMATFRKGNCSVINNIVQMGGEPGHFGGVNGIFYLQTNGEPLFGKGHEGMFEQLKTAKLNISMESVSLKISKFTRKSSKEVICDQKI